MNYELINKTIGLMDFDLIEAADEAPQSAGAARVTPFVKSPWLKWVAAAVAIIVFAVGTPIALNMMGAFRSDNIVAPGSDSGDSSSEEDNPGVVTPIDDSGSAVVEPKSSSAPDSENRSSAESGAKPTHSVSPYNGGAQSGGEGNSASNGGQTSPETPSDPVTPPDEPPTEPTEGEFVKENMPAVTYRINGEEKTFTYQRSTSVIIDESGRGTDCIIDHYASGGGSVSIDSASGKLVRYEADGAFEGEPAEVIEDQLSVFRALETAKRIVMNTDIDTQGMENASVSVRYADNKYFIPLTTAERSIEVCLYNTEELVSIDIIDYFPIEE